MLISPPFLPATNGSADDNWLNDAMTNADNEGAYPLTSGLAWHGGVHLASPSNSPVRAIADGKIVYVRQATARNANENDPLNYHAGGSLSGWTSDGCVVIRHDTEIGEGDNSDVRFFSIYMHLEDISGNIIINKAIYRKDSIGQAGYINGKTGRIHFEIICDDANVAKLIGRRAGDVVVNTDGRRDAVYGDMYFHLPVGTPLFATRPTRQPAAIAPVHTTLEALFVGIRYAGIGFVTTYQVNGRKVGETLEENEYEYNLYQTATNLATQCPSAAYELLRFGRVLGPDALAPANAPHWRQICYPGGQGWINLAPAAINKFSDSDFPHWRGWTLVDDSADLDSRMDSPVIRNWLDTDHDGKVTPDEARSQLLTLEVKNKLKGVICKIPTEWNGATIDARWGWLKTITPEHPEKLENSDFDELKKHIAKLCFWEDANLGIDANHWHFDPREFIRHFRKCGWLSKNELIQSIPISIKKLSNTLFHSENIGTNSAIQSRIDRWHIPLNTTLRKYNIDQSIRRVFFFANVWEETGYLRLMVESGGAQASYAPWFGRGLIQLTHLENYKWYGKYRGFQSTLTAGPYLQLGWNPDQLISQNDKNCIDTTVYWINPLATAIGHNILIDADNGFTQATSMQTARGTNGNVATKNINGLDGRLQIAIYLKHALLDSVREKNTESVTFSWRKSSQKTGTIIANDAAKRIYEDHTHTINVDISPRRPS